MATDVAQPGGRPYVKTTIPPLARGRCGQGFVLVTSSIVIVSEHVELAGDLARNEYKVRWRRRGGSGPSDGPSEDGPSPTGASASGRRRTRLRLAGTGAVAIVMFPRWMFASMRALLETVTWF